MRRSDFPIYQTIPHLIYLDSGATALKPQRVIDSMCGYLRDYSSNIHRGLYPISVQASLAYEGARHTVATFIHAAEDAEIIFTKGASEGLNLLASSLSTYISEGDEIACTMLEHHSNFVPWQELALRRDAKFVVMEPTEDIVKSCKTLINERTKVFTFPYMSNVTGEVLQVKQIIQAVKKINPSTICIVDAAQAVAHIPVDVRDLDCDYLVFSGHKLYGPTGIGVLYGKRALLELLPPYQYGGDMIHSVSIKKTTYSGLPNKFEAGTPPIAEAIGLAEAIRYVLDIGFDTIAKHDAELLRYFEEKVAKSLPQLQTIQPQFGGIKTAVASFTLPMIHPHDMADLLGQKDICVRAGHHCAQPLHIYLKLSASCRVSFGVYNSASDIDSFAEGLATICQSFL